MRNIGTSTAASRDLEKQTPYRGRDGNIALKEKHARGGDTSSSSGSGRGSRSQGRPSRDGAPSRQHRRPNNAARPDTEERSSSGLGRVLSRMSSRVAADPGPPPDGGFQAWLQCIACFLVVANTWGWLNSFGAFQAYYADTLDRPRSDISWIGSLATFNLFFVGTITGRLTDAGYFRIVFAIGTAFLAVGVFTMSVSTTYWQMMLSQGLCMGLGNGFCFCPILAVMSAYFLKRRSIALGVAACGSVVGGIIYPLMVRQLLPQIGFGWTVRAMGFIQLGTMIVANIIARPRLPPRKAGPLVELAAFKELPYAFYAASAFFNFWGTFFPFFYLAIYSREEVTPGLSYTDSLNLLLILNAIGIIGRLVPNWIADRVGPINVFIPISFSSSVLLFGWIGVRTPSALYGWAVLYGIPAAAIQSLFPAALSSLTDDMSKLGVRIGMVFTINSFGVLTGPPIAGAIITAGGSYAGAQAFSGTAIGLGCVCLILAKVSKMRAKGLGWTDKV